MFNKKRKSRVPVLLGGLGIALSLFLCPVAELPAQAAASPNIFVQPLKDDIRYRFAIFGDKLYKRLYNYSTSTWIGDWIYVCDVP